MAASFKRSGLYRIECDCGAYVYATVAVLECHGLPTCPCGGAMLPTRREVAVHLGLTCPATVAYDAAIAMGLSEADAAVWVETERRKLSRARRMAAIGQS